MSELIIFPSSVDEFIAEGNLGTQNTINPLFRIAAANMLMTRALQAALNAQTDAVRLLAKETEEVSKLKADITALFSNTNDLTAKRPFARDNTEAKRLLDAMLIYGVPEEELRPWLKSYKDNPSTRLQVNDSDLKKFSGYIDAYSDSLNTRNSKEQLTLQSLTNRYTQAGEQASNVLQKDAQSKGTIITNSRGLS
ncbi:MAG: hypothetical protein RLZ92_1872 [Pseudomonadota bacterium]|jgi:hypothetical protein